MKSIFIALLAIIIIGALWLTKEPNEDTTLPVVEDTSTQSTTNEETKTVDNETEEDHGVMVETSGGTDVGMEMPIPDADTNVPEMIVIDQSAKIFNVEGTNFAYGTKEIRVTQGDTVTIHFTSTDGFHDWVVDEFDARTSKVQTGGTSSVTFVVDKKGTFEYYCSVGQHRANGMVGKLIVE